MSITSQFQSTLPVWGGTLPSGFSMAFSMMFQSTLPVWGGTPVFCRLPATRWRFNPPSPCGEGRPGLTQMDISKRLFQSTLPVWGGTAGSFFNLLAVPISIHPPRVGRDCRSAPRRSRRAISIHPPRVGRDTSNLVHGDGDVDFNPPSPCGEGQQKLTKILCKLLR